jgi:hypothetical protein
LPPEAVAIASRQHGRIARRQLREAGCGRSAISRLAERGWLRRVHLGVYAVAGAPETRKATWMAAVLAGGEGAALSHRSACELWGLMKPIEGPAHVTTPSGAGARRGIIFHRSRCLGYHRALIDGVPVTTIERSLLDFATTASAGAVRAAFACADGRGLLDPAVMAELCASSGRKQSGLLAVLARECAPQDLTRSPLEREFARFCAQEDIPPPLLNVVVEAFEVDCFWPEARLVVELDGFSHHRSRASFELDRRRDAALQLAGIRVFRVTSHRLRSERADLATDLHAALKQRPHPAS